MTNVNKNNENYPLLNTKEPHEIANIFPMMNQRELKELAEDIKRNGMREKILTYEGKILDGRNRQAACVLAGKQTEFEDFTGENPLDYVLSRNLHRRHLSTGQRALIAAGLANLKRGDNQYASFAATSQGEAGKLLKVSRSNVQRASKVLESGIEDLKQAVMHGEISVSAASDLSARPAEEQKDILDKPKKQRLAAIKQIGKHPIECDCPECADQKLRTNQITLNLTDAELARVDKARKRHDFSDDLVLFIQELVLANCAENVLPSTMPEMKKWAKKHQPTDPNHDPEAEKADKKAEAVYYKKKKSRNSHKIKL